MQIKLGKFSTDIPAWVVALTVIAADSMYANHCRKKSYENALKAVTQPENSKEKS